MTLWGTQILIRHCNGTFWVAQEKVVARRIWNFSKENLGFLDSERDHVYEEQIQEMERRDSNALALREKKNL